MRVQLSSKAQKELDKIDDKTALRISRKIYQLEINPYGLDSQKLAGGKGYRIRIGDYRLEVVSKPSSLRGRSVATDVAIYINQDRHARYTRSR